MSKWGWLATLFTPPGSTPVSLILLLLLPRLGLPTDTVYTVFLFAIISWCCMGHGCSSMNFCSHKICDVSFHGSNINYVLIIYNDHFINWLLYPSVSLKKSTWDQLTQVHTRSFKFNNLMKSAYFY